MLELIKSLFNSNPRNPEETIYIQSTAFDKNGGREIFFESMDEEYFDPHILFGK